LKEKDEITACFLAWEQEEEKKVLSLLKERRAKLLTKLLEYYIFLYVV
jgi:hypothetical protein